MDLARAPRRTARKKGSGYENGLMQFASSGFEIDPIYLTISYPECTKYFRDLIALSWKDAQCFNILYFIPSVHLEACSVTSEYETSFRAHYRQGLWMGVKLSNLFSPLF
jgi:hypothetical protein